jgi:glyoxylase-like metal-dependent hydrolase (beta-lactamase superfamily II)
MPPVEKVRGNLWSIPVPLVEGSLRYTSVYALASDAGITLIDAGWDSDASWQVLLRGLAELGAPITDVHGVLVTHQHFDHIGLARRIREASGAWVAMHPADKEIISKRIVRGPTLALDEDREWLIWLGAPPEEALRLQSPHIVDRDAALIIPDRLVEDGDSIGAPGWSLRAIHTPGHTPGHLCFWDEPAGLFFAGDHVLPRISPNVSSTPDYRSDPLADFLESLDKVASYPAEEVLPAHEWRFKGLAARAAQLHAHHQLRLNELVDVVGRNPGGVPWELAGEMTWSRSWDQYDGYMRFIAVSETMAHLAHLVRAGLLVASSDAVPRYTRTGLHE